MADLSRDVENANPGLGQIFDKEKEQNRLKEAQLIGEIGNQVGDIARTQGDIEATKAGKAELAKQGINEPGTNASEEEIAAYNKALTDTSGYKQAQQQWGTGSAIQQGIQAATAAVQGLAGSNLGQALSGAAAPYLAEQIHKLTEGNPQAQAMAHAVVGAVVSYASGNSALAGAAGSISGEVMAQLVMNQLYPGKKVSELSETEKQTISALSTLAAGLAGGIASDGSAGAVAGAQAGKNSAENNALSFGTGMTSTGAANQSWNQYAVDKNLTPKETKAGMDKIVKGDFPEGANITKAIVEGYQDGVFMAGALYLGPTVTIGKGIAGAIIGGGANSAFQYMNMGSDSEFSYYGAAVAAGAGYLAPGYKIGGNTLINMGGAFMTDGPSLTAQSGAVAGSLAGGSFGKYVPDLLTPYVGSFSGVIGDIGSAFVFETSNDVTKEIINKKDN